jgi:uncharacterized PurR-regulated membrane protein YhhQ (DUF165 family)
MKISPMGLAWVVAYAATIVAANWSIAAFGIINVGFGFQAPAAVLFAGLAFTFRDFVHETAGRRWAIVAILIGGSLSFVLATPALAIASAVAFLVSEGLDLVVYDRLRGTGWLLAVGSSNVAGFTVDSILFLALAFGSLAFLPGQLLGKAYMTILAIVILAAARRWFPFGPLAPRHEVDARA